MSPAQTAEAPAQDLPRRKRSVTGTPSAGDPAAASVALPNAHGGGGKSRGRTVARQPGSVRTRRASARSTPHHSASPHGGPSRGEGVAAGGAAGSGGVAERDVGDREVGACDEQLTLVCSLLAVLVHPVGPA